jgi:hypothetical protein
VRAPDSRGVLNVDAGRPASRAVIDEIVLSLASLRVPSIVYLQTLHLNTGDRPPTPPAEGKLGCHNFPRRSTDAQVTVVRSNEPRAINAKRRSRGGPNSGFDPSPRHANDDLRCRAALMRIVIGPGGREYIAAVFGSREKLRVLHNAVAAEISHLCADADLHYRHCRVRQRLASRRRTRHRIEDRAATTGVKNHQPILVPVVGRIRVSVNL